MTNATPKKVTFEYQNRNWSAYWNGKEYAHETVYVTVTPSSNGSSVKINYSPEAGVSVGGTHSLDFGKTALRALGIIE